MSVAAICNFGLLFSTSKTAKFIFKVYHTRINNSAVGYFIIRRNYITNLYTNEYKNVKLSHRFRGV